MSETPEVTEPSLPGRPTRRSLLKGAAAAGAADSPCASPPCTAQNPGRSASVSSALFPGPAIFSASPAIL